MKFSIKNENLKIQVLRKFSKQNLKIQKLLQLASNPGRTANYAIVYARLLVHGQDLGIHNFMVQIRDLQTHKPMPGVEVGDIGPKIGYNNQDRPCSCPKNWPMTSLIKTFSKYPVIRGQRLLPFQPSSHSTDPDGYASCHTAS